MQPDPLLLQFTSRDPTSMHPPTADFVRIRRGAHYPAAAWRTLDAGARHALLVHASARYWSGSPGVISHESAAAIWGLPIIGPWPERVQLSTTDSSRRSQGCLQFHRIKRTAPRATDKDGLCLTNPAQTVVDLARSRPFRSGLATADAALRTELATRPELVELVAELSPSCPGRAVAALVAELADPLAESVLESLSRAVMYEQGFPRPQLQVPLEDSDGRFGQGDFGWPGLIGECDGEVKYGMDLSEGDPSAAVVREKWREDRIRRFSAVARWGWNDAFRVYGMVRKLSEKGLTLGHQTEWF